MHRTQIREETSPPNSLKAGTSNAIKDSEGCEEPIGQGSHLASLSSMGYPVVFLFQIAIDRCDSVSTTGDLMKPQ